MCGHPEPSRVGLEVFSVRSTAEPCTPFGSGPRRGTRAQALRRKRPSGGPSQGGREGWRYFHYTSPARRLRSRARKRSAESDPEGALRGPLPGRAGDIFPYESVIKLGSRASKSIQPSPPGAPGGPPEGYKYAKWLVNGFAAAKPDSVRKIPLALQPSPGGAPGGCRMGPALGL